MRKLFLTSIGVIIISAINPLFAQINFGLKGGINLSTYKNEGLGVKLTSKTLVGFHVGGYAEVGITEKLYIEPGIYYSQLGGKDKGVGYSSTLPLTYITLPVLMKYKVGNLSFLAGPQLGVLVAAKEKVDGVSTDVKSELKTTSVFGVFGAGYTLPMNVSFSVQYQYGFSSILKNSPDEKFKTGGLHLSVGYQF